MALTAKGQLAEARSALSRLVKEFPRFRRARLQLGLVAIGQQKYSEADAIFKDLHQTGPEDPRPTAGLVQSFAARNQFGEAVRFLQKTLEKTPQSVPLQRLMALTAVRAGQFDLALTHAHRLLASNPDPIEHNLMVADVYNLKGEHSNAVPLLEKVKRIAPKNPAAPVLLASAYQSAGMIEEAKTNYRLALAVQPGNAAVANKLV